MDVVRYVLSNDGRVGVLVVKGLVLRIADAGGIDARKVAVGHADWERLNDGGVRAVVRSAW